jgi:hypothetical protein
MVSIEKQIVAIVNTPLNTVEILSQQGMKGVRNSDGCSYFSGVACSWSIVRKRGALTQTTNNSSDGIGLAFQHLWPRRSSPVLLLCNPSNLRNWIPQMAQQEFSSGRRGKKFRDTSQD